MSSPSASLISTLIEMRHQWPNHVAAANGLSAVRSMDGHFPWRVVRPIGGGEAVADLIR